jgi:hypothetical protein
MQKVLKFMTIYIICFSGHFVTALGASGGVSGLRHRPADRLKPVGRHLRRTRGSLSGQTLSLCQIFLSWNKNKYQ